jgi:hypothetical protein
MGAPSTKETSVPDWPTEAQQQKICKRGDTMLCAAAGPAGCELCEPCQYTDEQLEAVRGRPAAVVRARHARHSEANPLACEGCFNNQPRDTRERLVTEHLDWLGRKPEPHVVEGLRGEIGRALAEFLDAQLAEARDWSAHEWRQWIDANLPPAPGASG